jgi:hypothetical protein
MFHHGDLSKRLMPADAEEQDADQAEIEEEEREDGTREDEIPEVEAYTPEVKELIEHVVANIISLEFREQQFMRADDTGRVIGHIGYIHPGLLERMRLLGQDPFRFVKNILKRRQSEREYMRRPGSDHNVYGRYVERYKYESYDDEGRWIHHSEWMVKIIEYYDYFSHGKVFTAPWHGKNPHEFNVKSLMVCCEVKSTSRRPFRDPKSLWWPSQEKTPIEELMPEGRVFIDGMMEVWVKLTESEYRDGFTGWNADRKQDAIENGLLLPSTIPRGMTPLREYLPRTVTHSAEEAHLAEEDPSAANFHVEEIAAGGMLEGGNRAQKKHKTKHKCKTKTKPKRKTKTKSKSKCKTKTNPRHN